VAPHQGRPTMTTNTSRAGRAGPPTVPVPPPVERAQPHAPDGATGLVALDPSFEAEVAVPVTAASPLTCGGQRTSASDHSHWGFADQVTWLTDRTTVNIKKGIL
jgi:hypothetical protein